MRRDVSRRAFLGLAASGVMQGFGRAAGQEARPAPPALPALPDLHVDSRKLRERIESLSVFGRPAGGTFADGVSRTAYSDADVEGRRYVMAQMKDAGLQPRIDPAGNIFARRDGAESRLAPILFGSHIDSVPGGG